MTLQELRTSLKNDAPPASLPLLLQSLWHDAKGDWTRAHEIAQEVESPEGAWVHAYLHRKEGDISNARYWYGKAGKSLCKESHEEEWAEISDRLLRLEFHT